jgi:RNA polymerase sigma-70 factor (ECF subfamily)
MSTEVIWTEFSNRLRGFINSKINNQEISEDLLQDVFIKIHLNANQLKDDGKLSSWVYTITRNVINDYYRKRKLLSDDNAEVNNIEAEEISEEEPYDFVQCMKPFVEELPEKYQKALTKTSFENVSQKDFAEAENLSYTAAKSRVQRARKMIKDKVVACCNPVVDVYGNVISKDDECKNDCGCE